MRTAMIRLFSLLLLVLLTACDARTDRREGPPRVLCTIGMITDLVQQVAGEDAEVVGLIGAGIDPHLYQPTRSDVAAMQLADVIFYCGLQLEGKMADKLVLMANRGTKVVAVTQELDEDLLLEPDDNPGHSDPHVWMDASAWATAIPVIVATLSEAIPGKKEAFAQRGALLQDQLQEVDVYARKVLATIPEAQRVMITAHDAFNYFGRAYGLEVLGIQGLSTESEAGLNDINRLVQLIVDRNVKAVFVETSVADKNVRALIEGAGSRGHEVTIGGTLFSDAMGRPGTYEGTYIGMLDHNATVVARALGGKAEPGGMQGKLAEGGASE